MDALVESFVSADDRERIEKAVAAAERRAGGEIVCLIVPSSYRYPMATVLGATTLALPLSLAATHLLGGWLWIGTQNMWLFLGLFALLYTLMHWLVACCPALKRRFISRREIDEEVEEAAVSAFFKRGLHRTRESTGVLLFVSVFERKVWLLADTGIHARVPQAEWDRLVAHVIGRVREGRRVEGICEAVASIGDLLQAHVPVKPDDRDELDNLIVDAG